MAKANIKNIEKFEEGEIRQDNTMEIPDDAKIEVGDPVLMPSLNSPEGIGDPWKHLKEYNPDGSEKYYYRGLNVRRHILDKRKAQGYEVVPGQENPYGDLIFGRMLKERREAREKQKKVKRKRMTEATVERFKEDARRHGVETFEEK